MIKYKTTSTGEATARIEDSEFLKRVRSSSLEQLKLLLRDHSHKNTPRWKRVAIRRSIAKIEPHSVEWTLGLDEIRDRDLSPWQRSILYQALERFDLDTDPEDI